MLQTYCRCPWRSLMSRKLFLTNLQHLELSQFSTNEHNEWYLILHTLWNQLPLELCEINFFYSCQCFLSILCRYVTNILKICMKKFNSEFFFFFTNLQGFELSYIQTAAHCGGYTVSHACRQFLVCICKKWVFSGFFGKKIIVIIRSL